MMKRNPWNWRSLLLGLAVVPLGLATATAQDCPGLGLNIGDPCDDGVATTVGDVVTAACECVGQPAGDPTSVDIDLVLNTNLNRLEVFLRPNGDDFLGVVSGLTFTIQWPSTSPATLGTRVVTCSGVSPSPTAQVTAGGFKYRTFNAFGTDLLVDVACPWTAGVWQSVCTIPVTGNTGCTAFQIVNNGSGQPNNTNYFISLGGIEETGTIEPTAVNFGSCTVDCLGVIGGTALPGTACNDNNACTINDVYTGTAPNCGCAGTPDNTDTDGDGVPNCSDNCPNVAGQIGSACNDNNACTTGDVLNASCVCTGTLNNTDTDGDGVPNCSDNCPNVAGQIGSACNDNNACTDNDVLNASCVCAGTLNNTDTDGDGVPNCSDNCPNVAGQIGSACNDNNACTDNDVLNASCVCAGTLNNTDTDGDGVPNCSDNCPNVAGQIGSACNDNNACTDNDVLNASCVCAGTLNNTDTDGDGVPNCSDNCPNVAGQIGSACNDNNACTDNDVLNASCVCAGTLNNTDTDGDGVPNCSDNCPNVAGQIGSACDDNNALTINDELGATCVCAGTPVSCVTAGDCNDSDPCTSDACVANACVYTPITTDTDGDGVPNCSDNCPNVAGQIGSACDDGNACTDNDVLNASCVCAGTLNNTDTDGDGVPNCSDNCPAVAGQQGSTCDDNNALTINDVLNASCVCVGTTVGCVVTGDCNDNDVCTSDACVANACVYTPLTADADGDGTPDCADNCPNVAGQQGSTCDDGNALTINDVLDANCACVGTTVGCVVTGDCNDNDACTSDACVANACVYTPLPDGDSDGTCDAIDGCPTDPAKIAPGTCGCGVADTDTDGDGAADCVDPCPIVANIAPGDPCDDGNALTVNDQYSANCVCAGTPVSCAVAGDCNDNDACTIDDCVANTCVFTPAADTDGDGTCDAIDGCPADANKIAPGVCGCGNLEPGTACNDNNAGTTNDQIGTNCVCAGTPLGDDCLGVPGGSALPGTACDDNDPNTGNDTWSANCVCVGQPIDCLGVPGGTATVGSACNDGDACTTGDVYNASCDCVGTLQDTDGDGVCNANDNCPNVAGQIGSVCDDNNANTINDVLNANCQCQGQPIGGCTENLTLSITLDANGSQTTWTLFDATEVGILDAGGPYTDGTPGAVITEDICVPAGCYHLRFSDSGNDGITGGGYVLRNANNKRIIDASVGSFTSTSEIGGTTNRTFCVPVGALNILNNWCDRSNLLITSPVYCNAQPGATGYQWWIYNAHGSYNRRVTLATNVMVPGNLNTLPVPTNTWLNLRVRPVFSGGPGEFGPACRAKFLPNTAGPNSSREVMFDEATNVTMSLYPNPNRDGLVTLSMEGVDVADETMIDIDVYDMVGKRVFTERAVAAEGIVNHRMDLSSRTGAGLYMVNVSIDGKLYTQRLVIQ